MRPCTVLVGPGDLLVGTWAESQMEGTDAVTCHAEVSQLSSRLSAIVSPVKLWKLEELDLTDLGT